MAVENGITRVISNGSEGEAYFLNNPAPTGLERHRKLVRAFVTDQVYSHRKIVFITSGGTTVPLENQTVRFIDNFSAGTRGATSAEYFLEAGYAVIFLHRQYSLLPYSRHYSHSTNCFLDYMTEASDGSVMVDPSYQDKMRKVLGKYNLAKSENRLLPLTFITINDYLWNLKDISCLLRPLGPRSIFYLAAAVSDFFLPRDRLSEHKIQSSDPTKYTRGQSTDHKNGKDDTPRSRHLVINLDPVPKILKNLVEGWAPQGMIVSFKLETDPDLLISKSRQALARYQHHLVIGNMLSSRKHEVVFVTNEEEYWITIPHHRRTLSTTSAAFLKKSLPDEDLAPADTGQEDPLEIESKIIPEVVKLHKKFVQSTEEDQEVDEQHMLANALAWAEHGAD